MLYGLDLGQEEYFSEDALLVMRIECKPISLKAVLAAKEEDQEDYSSSCFFVDANIDTEAGIIKMDCSLSYVCNDGEEVEVKELSHFEKRQIKRFVKCNLKKFSQQYTGGYYNGESNRL